MVKGVVDGRLMVLLGGWKDELATEISLYSCE